MTVHEIKRREQRSFFSSDVAPFLKWPGGKTSELPKIELAMPDQPIERYIEPFVGGGSVLLALDQSVPAFANDICPELIALYSDPSRGSSELRRELLKLAHIWDRISEMDATWNEISSSLSKSKTSPNAVVGLVEHELSEEILLFGQEFLAEFSRRLSRDLPTKLRRVAKLQIERSRVLPLTEFAKNLEGSIRAAFYMAVRNRYNQRRISEVFDSIRIADFFFLREYCYASMFRFNSKGEFNVPYGGISYNRKRFLEKVQRLYSEPTVQRLLNTDFHNLDFQDFFDRVQPTQRDFIFVDPPYDSDFTDYDNKEFREHDQERLSSFLTKTPARVMIVIGDTDLVRSLYPPPKWRVQEDQMNYKWTIKDRNERSKIHLTITNY